MSDLDKVDAQIALVEQEIKEANEKASAAPNVEERNHWWKKEEQLRKKEEQLRKEKEQLRKEKEQLREEKITLLKQADGKKKTHEY